MRSSSAAALLLCVSLRAFAQTPARTSFSDLKLPRSVTKTLLQGLLQRFVDCAYGKSFRHLGDERDFDHGHLLFAPGSSQPVAVLYHTQELAFEQPAKSPYAFLDPAGRNWLQWVRDGRVENAAAYARKGYPDTAFWNWFVAAELPALQAHHTILDKMLDPAAVGADTDRSAQWVFTRADCPAAPPSREGNDIQVVLPGQGRVCLLLSRS